MGFPGGPDGKESACTVGDLGLIPGLGRSPCRRERLLTPVFWPRALHGLYSPWGHKELGMTERLEEGMATHSSILAGESPWTEEPGRLQSMR